jgi:hypothetical protein
MSGEDFTREASLEYRKGVDSARKWVWWPFSVFRIESQMAVSYGLQVYLGIGQVQLSFMVPK